MRSKKEIELDKADRIWATYCDSPEGRESAQWTEVPGDMTGLIDGCRVTYGPDGCTYYGPSFGPLTVTGPNALELFNRVAIKHC